MLSSDVLKQRYSRSPFTAQRRAAASRTDPRHAKLLDLQRQAGNKAVSQMVAAQRQTAGGSSVQRAMTTKYTDLRAQFILRGTYGKIVRMLADLEATRSPEMRLHLATALRGLCNTWLKSHGRPASAKEQKQRNQIEQLEAESFREMGVIAAQMKYLKGFDAPDAAAAQGPAQGQSGRPPLLPGVAPNGRGYLKAPFDPNKQFGQFEALSMGARVNAAGPAKELAAGRAMKANATAGTSERAARLAAKYKLSAAEIAAIRTFTMPDYAYINPAVQNDPERLPGALGQAKDTYIKKLISEAGGVEKASREGAMHAGVFMQALAKLPPYAKPTFRGERLSLSDFLMRYRKGSVLTAAHAMPSIQDSNVTFTRFGSASKERNVASTYADGEGDVTPKADQTVSVMLEIEMNNGRDISLLSGAVMKEEEVLILVGAKFEIQQIKFRDKEEQHAGKPPATAWYVVKLKQVA